MHCGKNSQSREPLRRSKLEVRRMHTWSHCARSSGYAFHHVTIRVDFLHLRGSISSLGRGTALMSALYATRVRVCDFMKYNFV